MQRVPTPPLARQYPHHPIDGLMPDDSFHAPGSQGPAWEAPVVRPGRHIRRVVEVSGDVVNIKRRIELFAGLVDRARRTMVSRHTSPGNSHDNTLEPIR